MRDIKEINSLYDLWYNKIEDKSVLEELESMDENKKVESFGSDLNFGTGGLRGILGVGTALMNTYNISKVTRGLASYIKKQYNEENITVAIASDPRHMSKEFIELVISILAKENIKSIIFDDIKPTPLLSYVVKKYNCQAGIMITASHNPKEYNGYKVYNHTGCQLSLEESDLMINEVEKQEYIFCEKILDKNDLIEDGFVKVLDEEIDQIYFEDIKPILKNDNEKKLNIVFTPEHGTTYKILPKAFKYFGFSNVIPVKEQMIPDGDFPNTKSANPEDVEAYELAIEYGHKFNGDLIISNDPDGDRLGIMFKNKDGIFESLSGNQTGTLLIDYLINRDNLTSGVIYKTIVTGEMGANIAKSKGIDVKETLTGFKFIGKEIEENPNGKLILGYEESYGYLINPHVRDKDSIQSSLLISEMTDYYLNKGIYLDQRLEELYKEYGYSYEITNSILLKGLEGTEKIQRVLKYYKDNEIEKFSNYYVENKIDYNLPQGNLPASNVIKFIIKDIGWVVFRPSGTEPKLKVYISTKGNSYENAKQISIDIYEEIKNVMEGI